MDKLKFRKFPALHVLKTKGRADRLYVNWPPELSGTGKWRREYFGPASAPESRARYLAARVRIICAMFAWGARHRTETGERLVPPAVASELKLVEMLRRGYCQAKDHPRKLAVPIKTIEQTVKHLDGPVAAMVRLQLITGARPNEIRRMKGREITRAEKDLWEYRPESYKTEHQDREGERKVIYLGPRAIKVLRPILNRQKDGGYLFRPAAAAAERRQRSETKKKTPSRKARDRERAENPRRVYADHYSSTAYRNAVQRAAVRAGVEPWTPYQIRKARATEIDKTYGQEAAAIQLGHRNVKITLDHYIDPRNQQARDLARKIG